MSLSWQEELLKIQKRNNGLLHPKDVIKEARNKKSTLHPFFDWDDSSAAEKFRVFQAENLIRRVKVEITQRDDESVFVRQFVSLPSDRKPLDTYEGGYRHIDSVLSETELRLEYLKSIQAEISTLIVKLKGVSNMAFDKGIELRKEIDSEIKKFDELTAEA